MDLEDLDPEELFPFTLPSIFKRLKLPEAAVLNVYLLGSRLWGTSTYQSDYDLLVVMKAWPAPNPPTVHNGQFDARVLSQEDFLDRLREHEFEMLKCCWLPRPFVLQESVSALGLLQDGAGGIDPVRLKATVLERMEKDVVKAGKFLEKGKAVEGGKIVLHALRLAELAGQILREGKIGDFHALDQRLDEAGISREAGSVRLDNKTRGIIKEAREMVARAEAAKEGTQEAQIEEYIGE